MPAFSLKSRERLNSCDKKLQDVFNEVIKHVDCAVLEGHRGNTRQNELFRQGKSQLKAGMSKHNYLPSRAVDVAPYPINWNDREHWLVFGGFVKGIAASMSIRLRWGGDWDGDFSTTDQNFHDLPHFELMEDH